MRIDTLYTGGRIRTLAAERPVASRIGVLNGRIVGLDEELDGVAAERVVDLDGAPVLPGFHDAHYHLSLTGARLAALDLRPGRIGSLEELYAAVRERAEASPPDAWVRGSGYDQNHLEDHPTADALDAVAGGRPVLLEHVSAHMTVANTRAFELAGYSGRVGVPEVEGGHIPRDPDGRPIGLLQEQAMKLIYALVRPMPVDEVLRNLRLAYDQALSYGLTSVTEPGIGAYDMLGNSPVDFHAYQLAHEQGILQVRTTLMPFISTLHDLAPDADNDWFGLDLGIRTGLGDDMLRVGPVKCISDGSFIGRSAAMHACYKGETDNNGVLLFPEDRLRDFIIRAHASGWTVATHAIGDRAADLVLAAVEEAQRLRPRPEVRHRIEHFAVATDERIRRTADLGIIAVPQAIFISDFGDGMADAVDDELAPLIYRMKALLDAGIVMPGSTDSPVSDGNPLTCIRDMVLRRTKSGRVLGPDERLTIDEAIRAYTHGSAYAVSQEDDKGTLETGKLADFIVLSDDLYQVDPERITDQQVVATVVGGEVRFGDL